MLDPKPVVTEQPVARFGVPIPADWFDPSPLCHLVVTNNLAQAVWDEDKPFGQVVQDTDLEEEWQILKVPWVVVRAHPRDAARRAAHVLGPQGELPGSFRDGPRRQSTQQGADNLAGLVDQTASQVLLEDRREKKELRREQPGTHAGTGTTRQSASRASNVQHQAKSMARRGGLLRAGRHPQEPDAGTSEQAGTVEVLESGRGTREQRAGCSAGCSA